MYKPSRDRQAPNMSMEDAYANPDQQTIAVVQSRTHLLVTLG